MDKMLTKITRSSVIRRRKLLESLRSIRVAIGVRNNNLEHLMVEMRVLYEGKEYSLEEAEAVLIKDLEDNLRMIVK